MMRPAYIYIHMKWGCVCNVELWGTTLLALQNFSRSATQVADLSEWASNLSA